MKISYKYDVHNGKTVAFVAKTLKQAREFKKQLKQSGKEAYIVKQQYMPIYEKLVG